MIDFSFYGYFILRKVIILFLKTDNLSNRKPLNHIFYYLSIYRLIYINIASGQCFSNSVLSTPKYIIIIGSFSFHVEHCYASLVSYLPKPKNYYYA